MLRTIALTILLVPLAGSAPEPGTDQFTLVKEEQHIRIYCRWVPVDATRNARQLKAEFTVNESPDRIVRLLRDDSRVTGWMKNTSMYYRVRTLNDTNWYSYIRFSVPWPLSNQDCVLHYSLSGPSSRGEVRIMARSEPELLRTFDGVKRIAHLEAEWILDPVGPRTTRVQYLLFSRQPSRYPRGITDPIIRNNLYETMYAFRAMLGETF